MKRVLLLLVFIIVSGIALLLFIMNRESNLECGNIDDFILVCGNQSFTEVESEGRNLFNANCASCHKLTKNMTGPALEDIGKKFDSIDIIKYLRGDRNTIESNNYGSECLVFQNLSDEDILKIISYTDH